jgi:hypothetical protein
MLPSGDIRRVFQSTAFGNSRAFFLTLTLVSCPGKRAPRHPENSYRVPDFFTDDENQRLCRIILLAIFSACWIIPTFTGMFMTLMESLTDIAVRASTQYLIESCFY